MSAGPTKVSKKRQVFLASFRRKTCCSAVNCSCGGNNGWLTHHITAGEINQSAKRGKTATLASSWPGFTKNSSNTPVTANAGQIHINWKAPRRLVSSWRLAPAEGFHSSKCLWEASTRHIVWLMAFTLNRASCGKQKRESNACMQCLPVKRTVVLTCWRKLMSADF